MLNLYTGDVSNTVSGGDALAVFAYTDFIDYESFPLVVDGVDIKYLSMHYLLVSESRSLVEVTIAFKTADGAEDKLSQTIENVPLQRNYRTNLYGNFFTEEVTYTVIIDPEYMTPDYDEEYNIPSE